MVRTILAAELTVLAVGMPMTALKKRVKDGNRYIDRVVIDKVTTIYLEKNGIKIWYQKYGYITNGWYRKKELKDAFVMLAFDDGVEIEW